MPDILQMHIQNIFYCDNYCILIQISLAFIPEGPIDNDRAHVQIMAWCFTHNKPSPDSVLFQIIAIYVFLGINELNLYCICTSQLIYISSYQLPHIVVNSLALGKFGWNFRHIIFKQVLVIDGWGISSEINLIWMPLNFTYDQSTLVQVMVWCRQAISHYVSQCWPRPLSPYDVTRPQWVNTLGSDQIIHTWLW